MNKLVIVLLVILCSACAQPPAQPQQISSTAADSLNQQIAKFNANRDGTMGISPIEKRVSRVDYSAESDQVTTFDQHGNPFIVLKKGPDGRFKGVLEQPYHRLATSGPDGSHSWGHVLVEFFLEKGMF